MPPDGIVTTKIMWPSTSGTSPPTLVFGVASEPATYLNFVPGDDEIAQSISVSPVGQYGA